MRVLISSTTLLSFSTQLNLSDKLTIILLSSVEDSYDLYLSLALALPHSLFGATVSPCPSRVVASLLSFCASPCIAPDGARAPSRTRWQTAGTTLPAAYSSDASGKNQPTVDTPGTALLSPIPHPPLHPFPLHTAQRHPH